MRNMSFALTTQQIKNRSKTVTRRKGWSDLKPGTLIQAVVKSMGLKPGEQLEPLAVLHVVDVRREPLYLITNLDVEREGFEMEAEDFVKMFCEHMGGSWVQEVTRIQFNYVPGGRLC